VDAKDYGVDGKVRPLFIGYDANGRKMYVDFNESHHMHLIGSTGMGKSKLMEWMLRGHIKNGDSFTLIDPHGFLYEDILKWCAYHVLDREIVLLNPSEGDYVIGFNPFQKKEGIDLSVQIDHQITSVIRAWGAENTDETPNIERWLRNMWEVISEGNQTLVAAEYLVNFSKDRDVLRFLASFARRKSVQDDWENACDAKSFIQFYGNLGILSTKNRLDRFLAYPNVLRFMGAREHNVDIGEIIDKGKILLVNLKPSDSFSEENARVFGALLVNEFFRQALRRKRDRFGNPPRPHYLYIDEFQNFVTTHDIAGMLDQVRKFGLHLILAHQRLGQIEENKADNLVDALFTNIKTRAVFGGLTRQAAEYVAKNAFVNQLDLKQMKKALYQVRFWPVYGRDKVYASTYGYSAGGSSLLSSSSGSAVHSAPPGEGWFDGWVEPPILSTTGSRGSVSANGDFWGDSWSDTEIDTPIFYPVPYYELSSMEYWNKDEQIWKMSEALMAQLLRHCFIQLPGQKTQPMLVPFVKEFYVLPQFFLEYIERLCKKEGALSKEDMDMLVAQERERLEQSAQVYALQEASGDLIEPPTFREATKAVTKKKTIPPEE
jgi:hypothetical protein